MADCFSKNRFLSEKTFQKLHARFLKDLQLPHLDLVIHNSSCTEGDFIILGKLTFHEFFKNCPETIEIYTRNIDGNCRKPYEIIATYIHEITHYYLFIHGRPVYHGKEFDRKKEILMERFYKLIGKERRNQ